MYPHRIRLAGPWECVPLARSTNADLPSPAPCRMTMPCRWHQGGLMDFAGRVRFLRRFGAPRQLDANERVWLTFAAVETVAEIWLNGELLGGHEGAGLFEFEITTRLHGRNELRVEVAGGAETGGLTGEVALEIRATAFLRAVRIAAEREGETARLVVCGEVVGSAERVLELYVLLNNATVAYGTVAVAQDGQPFRMVSEEVLLKGEPPYRVRVELVNGAVVWYQIEEVISPVVWRMPDSGP